MYNWITKEFTSSTRGMTHNISHNKNLTLLLNINFSAYVLLEFQLWQNKNTLFHATDFSQWNKLIAEDLDILL